MRYVYSRVLDPSTDIDTARLYKPDVSITNIKLAVIHRLFGYVIFHYTGIFVDKHAYKVNGQLDE